MSIWQRPGNYVVGDNPIDDSKVKLVFKDSAVRKTFIKDTLLPAHAASVEQVNGYTLVRAISNVAADMGEVVATIWRNGVATDVKLVRVSPNAVIWTAVALDVVQKTWQQYWNAENDAFLFLLSAEVVYSPYTKTRLDTPVYIYATDHVYNMASANGLSAGATYVASMILRGQGVGTTAGLVVTNQRLTLQPGEYQAASVVATTKLATVIYGALLFRRQMDSAVTGLKGQDLEDLFTEIENLPAENPAPEPKPIRFGPDIVILPEPDKLKETRCVNPLNGINFANTVAPLYSVDGHSAISNGNYSADEAAILRGEVDLRTSHIKLIAQNMSAGDYATNDMYYQEHVSVDQSGANVGWPRGSQAMIKSESDMQLLAVCSKATKEQEASWKPVFGLETTIWRKDVIANKWELIEISCC